jgi:CRP-like cAMP-binding protein
MVPSLALAQVPLFAGLSAVELERLSIGLRRRHYPKGTVVVWRGEPGTTLYIIDVGRAKVVITSPKGQEAILNVLGPGDFFGDIALLDRHPRTADVIAVEDSHLLLLERDILVRAIEESPRLALGLLAALAGRLRYDVDLLEEASFLDVPARLAKVLLRLAEGSAGRDGMALSIPTRWTQTELAGLAGASRESVNRWLRFYEERRIIGYQHGQILVLRPDELRKRSE